jgi:hypothetical protein
VATTLEITALEITALEITLRRVHSTFLPTLTAARGSMFPTSRKMHGNPTGFPDRSPMSAHAAWLPTSRCNPWTEATR